MSIYDDRRLKSSKLYLFNVMFRILHLAKTPSVKAISLHIRAKQLYDPQGYAILASIRLFEIHTLSFYKRNRISHFEKQDMGMDGCIYIKIIIIV